MHFTNSIIIIINMFYIVESNMILLETHMCLYIYTQS